MVFDKRQTRISQSFSSKLLMRMVDRTTGFPLHDIAGTQIARIERFTAREAFVLAMIKADAIFAKSPAEIHVLLSMMRRKIQQSDIEILDDAASLHDLGQRRAKSFRELLVLARTAASFSYGTITPPITAIREDTADKSLSSPDEFLAAAHGFHQNRFDFTASALRLGEREQPPRYFGCALWV